jgi:hypothetical protein
VGEHLDRQVDPAIQARVAEILTEIAEGMRWRSMAPSPPASSAGAPPEQHLLEQLEPDERILWDRVPAADRARLVREFRGGITANGRSYLAKVIVLLAPPAPDDQADAQPAVVSSSADGKGA